MENSEKRAGAPEEQLHSALQDMIGLHRQLYEIVKIEHEAIVQADTKGTYEALANKEALLHWIHQAELERQAITHRLNQAEGLPATVTRSLKEWIIHFEVVNPELSQRLQADLNALVILVERIKKQNEQNGRLVETSLRHITAMKNNIFGETTHQGKTYNQLGQKNQVSGAPHGPRLVSKEV